MTRTDAKVADRVHVVIGSMPDEFQEPKSAWTTKAAAEEEAGRLEKLAKDDPHAEELGMCEDFWVVSLDVLHKEARG